MWRYDPRVLADLAGDLHLIGTQLLNGGVKSALRLKGDYGPAASLWLLGGVEADVQAVGVKFGPVLAAVNLLKAELVTVEGHGSLHIGDREPDHCCSVDHQATSPICSRSWSATRSRRFESFSAAACSCSRI